MSNTNILNDYIAGAMGGMAGLVVGHPFDTTKVQMQTKQTDSPYKGTWDAIKNINKQGWSRGFFRGLGFPLVSYGICNSVFFGVYGHTLKIFKNGEDRNSTFREVYLAGCAGGFVQLFTVCPVEAVKVLLQSQISAQAASGKGIPHFKGPIQATSWLIKTKGITSLYRGFVVLFCRDVPMFGVFTVVHDQLSKMMIKYNFTDKKGIIAELVSGGIAGVTFWTLIIPFDVLKSLIQADAQQTKYKGMLDCARKLYLSRGIAGFYAGLGPIWARAFSVNAVTFLIYTKCLLFLNERHRPVASFIDERGTV